MIDSIAIIISLIIIVGFWHVLGFMIYAVFIMVAMKRLESKSNDVLPNWAIDLCIILGFICIPLFTIFDKRWHEICRDAKYCKKKKSNDGEIPKFLLKD